MGWIKRNLLFFIGVAIAGLLVGVSGFYIYSGWSRNSVASDKFTEVYGKLEELAKQNPHPGSDKINNTTLAREQEKQLVEWIANAKKYFQPIVSVPAGNVTSKNFSSALSLTIDELQRTAKGAGITLPDKYFFSFQAQSRELTLAQESLPLLSVQLGEVKTIAEILFAARINALDGIQRHRVALSDINGPQSDYVSGSPVTNEMAILTPYIVTFRSFTPELSRVITGFAKSPNAFIIKSINVQPAGAQAALTPGSTEMDNPIGMPSGMPGTPPRGRRMMMIDMPPGMGAGPGTAPAAALPTPGKGGLQTTLKEQLLRITMEVQTVKLLPSKS